MVPSGEGGAAEKKLAGELITASKKKAKAKEDYWFPKIDWVPFVYLLYLWWVKSRKE